MIDAAISTFCVVMSSLILFEITSKIKARIILRAFLGFAIIWTISFTPLVLFSNIALVVFLIFTGKIYSDSLDFWHLIYRSSLSVLIVTFINYILYNVAITYLKIPFVLAISSIITLGISVLLTNLDEFQALYYIDLNPVIVSSVVIVMLIFFLLLRSEYSRNTVYLFLTCFLVVLILVYKLAEYHERRKYNKEAYKLLIEYSQQLEELNNELSTFKHDYMNLLLTLKKSIDNNDQKEIQEIFYETILPSKYIISETNTNLEKYKHLKIIELKNLILSKELEAGQQEVKMDIRVIGIFDKVGIPVIDLVRIVSILIDNAIQAARQSTDDKRISVCLTKVENEITITVSNPIKGLNFDKEKMFEKEYSSTQDRNRGVGLFSLKRLVNKYPSVNLVTEFKEDFIYQSIIIGVFN